MLQKQTNVLIWAYRIAVSFCCACDLGQAMLHMIRFQSKMQRFLKVIPIFLKIFEKM